MTDAAAIDPNELRWKRNELTRTDRPLEGRREHRNATHTKLDTHLHRGHIQPWQYQAGDRFREDHEKGGLAPRTTPSYTERVDTSIRHDLSPAQMKARDRWHKAVRHLGEIGASVAVAVCCNNITAEAWAKSRGERREYGMGRLREALTDLADVYGIPGRPKR